MQAIRHENTLYLAGQIGLRGEEGLLPGLSAQIRRAMLNMETILDSQGVGLDAFLSVTCYITDEPDFVSFNNMYQECFGSIPLLVRTTVVVTELPMGALIEVTGIAGLPAPV